MKVTRFIDRKLLLVVSGPIVRHLANALSLYLAGQGVSAGLINQLEAGVIAAATLAINVLFELRDQGKVAEKSARKAAAHFSASGQDVSYHSLLAVPDPLRNVPPRVADLYEPLREKFDRESV